METGSNDKKDQSPSSSSQKAVGQGSSDFLESVGIHISARASFVEVPNASCWEAPPQYVADVQPTTSEVVVCASYSFSTFVGLFT